MKMSRPDELTPANAHSPESGANSVLQAKAVSVESPFSVAPEGAEDLLAHAHLGKRIKQLRLKRSMGLVELGRRTGLSASFLSQLETGRVVPTLRNLARLALVFEKDLSHFFETTDRRVFRIQRRKDRVRLPHGGVEPDYISESFGILIPEGGLRPCVAELQPGETRPFEPKMYPGTEMVYVLSGSAQLERKGQPYALTTRDVLYISGETPRTYRCLGDTPASLLIVSFDSESAEPPRIRRKSLNSAA
ncbi:helix-turn-helix domain-containing protein [Bryocella elongata]|nr:XRE family transcriptional regulator [Bryocella elongata]